jgi:DNA-binding transcriptional MerR regulator/methylmalonyl-CoA mutase cobalamin-binding subunit
MKQVSRTPAASSDAAPGARHPIGVVATRTGLSPDVLRVWERRYGAVTPARSPEGQRLYSDADVERLRWLRRAIDAGRSIGQIARLSSAALSALVEEDAAARVVEPAAGDSTRVDDVVADALAEIRALDATALDGTLRRAARLLGVTDFLEQVAAPLLRRIGDEWHAFRLSAAQEHLGSSVVQEIVIAAMRELSSANGAARMVVATPAGERHAAGAALVGARAAADGWSVIYLGADLPADEIATAAIATDARVVALSVVYVEDHTRLVRELLALRERLPAEAALLVGGAGAAPLRDELLPAGITVADELADLASFGGGR